MVTHAVTMVIHILTMVTNIVTMVTNIATVVTVIVTMITQVVTMVTHLVTTEKDHKKDKLRFGWGNRNMQERDNELSQKLSSCTLVNTSGAN